MFSNDARALLVLLVTLSMGFQGAHADVSSDAVCTSNSTYMSSQLLSYYPLPNLITLSNISNYCSSTTKSDKVHAL